MEAQSIEHIPSSCDNRNVASQSNVLQVPSTPYTNTCAVDSVMSINDGKKPQVTIEQAEAGDEKKVAELPKEWGTPFMRKLRCKFDLSLFSRHATNICQMHGRLPTARHSP